MGGKILDKIDLTSKCGDSSETDGDMEFSDEDLSEKASEINNVN